jgi:NTP pyrophosphatase (non-canonical NTP hydrolase)
MDEMKRSLDQLEKDVLRTEPDYAVVAERLKDPSVVRLLHAALGLVTEAGEFVDNLKRHIFYGLPIDKTNLKEELGDISWYARVGVLELETTLMEILHRNYEKLRVRYPDKFELDLALNRDLDKEREVLDATVSITSPIAVGSIVAINMQTGTLAPQKPPVPLEVLVPATHMFGCQVWVDLKGEERYERDCTCGLEERLNHLRSCGVVV